MDTRLLHPWDLLGKSTGVGCHLVVFKSPNFEFRQIWGSVSYELDDLELITVALYSPVSESLKWDS